MRRSKTWHYSIEKNGWDWYNHITGEKGFIPDTRRKGNQNTIEELSEKPKENEIIEEPHAEFESCIQRRLQKIIKSTK